MGEAVIWDDRGSQEIIADVPEHWGKQVPGHCVFLFLLTF